MRRPPTRPELLAPAGDPESLAAALAAGADAVYFGLDAGFNARARAANFAPEDLAETVARCHRAGVKVFLTLNTLIFESELDAVCGHIAHAARCGVDALIVQDPAVALLAGRVAPTLALHASTQMTVSSAEAGRLAEALGVVRVVVPRELSVAEIRRFASESALELEVFVHGALCVSWSGQCLTSEVWSGRSANRGQCAQSCRMPYDLVVDGQVRDLGDVRSLLSPKDLVGLRAVPELAEAGIASLKIEGRQKGPLYVATATRSYRRLLDAVGPGAGDAPQEGPSAVSHEVAAGVSDGVAESSQATNGLRAAAPRALARLAFEHTLSEDVRDMALAYSRGFSDGFLAGSDHQTLVEGRFPKHRGILLGRVVAVDRVAHTVRVTPDPEGRPWTGGLAASTPRVAPRGGLRSPLTGFGGSDGAATGPAAAPLRVEAGMGVVFDAGRPEDKSEPGGRVFSVTGVGKDLVLGFGRRGTDLSRVRPSDRAWVTSDPRIEKEVRRLLAVDRTQRIGLHLRVSGSAGGPLEVEARAEGGGEITVSGPTWLTAARGRGLDAALLREKLGAVGGTSFHLETLDISDLAADLHLPVRALKELRRDLVTRLDAVVFARGHAVAPDGGNRVGELRGSLMAGAAASADRASEEAPRLLVLCRSMEQLEAVIAAGLPEVELDWMELVGLRQAVARAREAGLAVTIASLRVQKPGEDGFGFALQKHAPDAVLIRHFGALVRFREAAAAGGGPAPRLHGDFSLNVTNSLTAWYLFGWGLDTITASHDLDARHLDDLLAAIPAHRVTVVIQHRIATFHTEHCVYSHLLSEGRDSRSCGRPCEAHEVSLRDHLGRQHPRIDLAGRAGRASRRRRALPPPGHHRAGGRGVSTQSLRPGPIRVADARRGSRPGGCSRAAARMWRSPRIDRAIRVAPHHPRATRPGAARPLRGGAAHSRVAGWTTTRGRSSAGATASGLRPRTARRSSETS